MDNNQGQELLETMSKLKKAMIKSHEINGISHHFIMTLRAIKHCEKSMSNRDLQGIKMSDISKHLDISRPATTQIINDLEKKGYVKRILTENDRRVVCICMTESGNQILKNGEKETFTIMTKIAERLGGDDTAELIRIISKLSSALADIKSEIK